MAKDSTIKKGYKQTEIGIIPEDWEVKACVDLCIKIQDGTHFSPKLGGSDYLYITSKNIGHGYLDISNAERIDTSQHRKIYARCDVKKGDLLLTKDGANTGNAAINPLREEFSLLSSVAFLRFSYKYYDPRFFLQFILSNIGLLRIKELMSGNAITRLTLEKIKGFYFPVPPTLPEQTAIAEVLSDTDALIENLENQIAKKKSIKQGTMQQLLTGKKKLPGFSGEWEVKKLGEISEITMGQSPKSSHYNIKGNGIPLIQGNADIEKRKTIIRIFTTEITKVCFAGDVIISVRAPVGQISRVMFNVCLGRGVCGIRYQNDYLYHYLINQESSWGKLSKGSTFDSVSSVDVKEFHINLPKSLAEQTAIAEILSDMDSEIEVLEQKCEKYKKIKQGMMQQLLTGKIRLVNP